MKKLFSKSSILADEEKCAELFDYHYAYKAILILTLGWLFFQVYEYQSAWINRPSILFEADNYFGKIFMNTLPLPWIFHGIVVLSFCVASFLLWNEYWWLRFVLAFCVSWLNLAQWSYGVLAGVGFLLIYAHLFSIFIPKVHSIKHEDRPFTLQSVKWFYIGIFFTYSLAGFWKLGGLLYKLISCIDCIHWLHPKAAWVTAAVSFRDYDFAYPSIIFTLLGYPIVWQLGFILVILTQFCSIVVAFVPKIRVWFLVILVVMHVINSIFFCTTFVVQPLVVCCLLFPYHRLFKKKFALYCTKNQIGS